MMMPDKIEEIMFAPCGMNCMVCYKHCNSKKPCAGCVKGDEGKPEHCRNCRIKDCVKNKGLIYCYQCYDFPCKLIKNLEKSYNLRYNASLIKNSLYVKEQGITLFMVQQIKQYTCSQCGGIISLHDAKCSECKECINR